MVTIGKKSTRLVLVRLNQGESRKGALTTEAPTPSLASHLQGRSFMTDRPRGSIRVVQEHGPGPWECQPSCPSISPEQLSPRPRPHQGASFNLASGSPAHSRHILRLMRPGMRKANTLDLHPMLSLTFTTLCRADSSQGRPAAGRCSRPGSVSEPAARGPDLLELRGLRLWAPRGQGSRSSEQTPAWLIPAQRSSCFLMSRKGGPFPTTELYLGILAGKSPSKSHEAPGSYHPSRKFSFL